jgi:hypothetical protein
MAKPPVKSKEVRGDGAGLPGSSRTRRSRGSTVRGRPADAMTGFPPPGGPGDPSGLRDLVQWRDLAIAAFIGSQSALAAGEGGSGAAGQLPVPRGLPAPAPGGIFAHAGAAAGWANAVDILRCRVVLRLVSELFEAALERELAGGVARRRPRCHMRQIAMYLSHVVLSVPYRTIARAFGRDRTTVVHACAVVEDRRDDLGYDRFVERCERCVNAVFAPFGGCRDES